MIAYLYASQVLPSALRAHPDPFGLMSRARAKRWLEDLWFKTAILLEIPPETCPSPRLLRSLPAVVGDGWVCTVIVLPPPPRVAEAYMVAVVGRVTADGSPTAVAGYFALEHSSLGPTMLCRWEPDGTHLNLGVGPIPDPHLFVQAIGDVLAANSSHEQPPKVMGSSAPAPAAELEPEPEPSEPRSIGSRQFTDRYYNGDDWSYETFTVTVGFEPPLMGVHETRTKASRSFNAPSRAPVRGHPLKLIDGRLACRSSYDGRLRPINPKQLKIVRQGLRRQVEWFTNDAPNDAMPVFWRAAWWATEE